MQQNLNTPNKIFYLPGRGGQLTAGLGQALLERGLEVQGRETRGEFNQLSFAQQVGLVASDLQAGFWDKRSHVIANSFGAYLFLHAQTMLPPNPGRVLLLSPIVGEFANEETQTFFSPPYPKRLMEFATAKKFPSPRNAQIHVGELDWQSLPDNVEQFGLLTNIPVKVVPGAGHMLPKQYVASVLDDWLSGRLPAVVSDQKQEPNEPEVF
ncbi:MAG: hypothetical protein LRY61_06920 [Burkholderiaceae bacterium]|nr:hypothetical protein [Burkholderiaceae bacterium]MCD8516982.1 hypothetical protein [Burkholderiaceae bacterium]